jgi:hypothetical protein
MASEPGLDNSPDEDDDGPTVEAPPEAEPLALSGKLVRVRYLHAMAGQHFTREVGQEYDIDTAEADRLVAAEFAEFVEDGEAPQKKKKKKGQ